MRLEKLSVLLCSVFLGSAADAQTASTPRWRLIEELRIGSIEGPQAITFVGELATSPDGQFLFVSQPQERLVRMFDAETGRFLRTIGRAGGGPGEFSWITSMRLKGDSLVVIDARAAYISIFSMSGEILSGSRVHSAPIESAGGLQAAPRFLAADGSIIGETDASSVGARAAGLVTQTWLAQMNRDGSLIRELGGRDLSGTGILIEGTDGRIIVGIRPLSENVFFRVAPNGSSLVLVDGRVSDGRAGTFFVTRLGLSGDTIYHRSYRYEPRAVPNEVADKILGSFVTASFPNIRDHIQLPSTLPPISGVTLNSDGSLWLRRGERNLQAVEWLVLGADGSIQASLTLPLHFRNPYVQGQRVWAEVRDELDVSYVVRYRIEQAN